MQITDEMLEDVANLIYDRTTMHKIGWHTLPSKAKEKYIDTSFSVLKLVEAYVILQEAKK